MELRRAPFASHAMEYLVLSTKRLQFTLDEESFGLR